MCILCSSCNFFLKPFYEDVVSDYSSKWMLINNTGSCLEIKMWNKGSVLFAFQTSRQTEFLNGEKVCVYSKESDNTIQFSSLISYFKSDVDYFLHCDSITFESCDGSEVYHVWRTSLEENGDHPFYQKENWRYESKDNGYTNCWYYTLTPDFLAE